MTFEQWLQELCALLSKRFTDFDFDDEDVRADYDAGRTPAEVAEGW